MRRLLCRRKGSCVHCGAIEIKSTLTETITEIFDKEYSINREFVMKTFCSVCGKEYKNQDDDNLVFTGAGWIKSNNDYSILDD